MLLARFRRAAVAGISGTALHCEPCGVLPSLARHVAAPARREAGYGGRTANIHTPPRTYLARRPPPAFQNFAAGGDRSTIQDEIPHPSPNRARRVCPGPGSRLPGEAATPPNFLSQAASGRLSALLHHRSGGHGGHSGAWLHARRMAAFARRGCTPIPVLGDA